MANLCNAKNLALILKSEQVETAEMVEMLVDGRGFNSNYIEKIGNMVDKKKEEEIVSEVDDLLARSEGRDIEVIKNDTFSGEQKVKLAVTELGSATKEDVMNWINQNNLLLKMSERNVRRVINDMIIEGSLVEEEEHVFLATTPPSRWVVLGERKVGEWKGEVLCFCGKLHEGIKLVDSGESPISGEGKWWEVGAKKENNSTLVFNLGYKELPVGEPSVGVRSNTGTMPKKFVGITSKTDLQIYLFARKYQKTWPGYHAVRNNCIHFRAAFEKFLVPNKA